MAAAGGWGTIILVAGIALLRARPEDVPKVVDAFGSLFGRCLSHRERCERKARQTNSVEEVDL
ncbi:hypothetical protein B0T44_18885 [Nocardia donostiensis]|uniref:Uncharacterized protein n=1 Tax=Nocardia donostiensis TaxID=1538463 RepID=A0A1V2T9W7_9NOCA|nr:hypothetical protein B0T46_23725 [Nocardia donostiensis]OQS13364.1 hypothetical protein B0T36_19840 [Nocardia donostiensis]OQS18561.1 hypothetical protein B0T44_18885 [Nocardia donostiensis]